MKYSVNLSDHRISRPSTAITTNSTSTSEHKLSFRRKLPVYGRRIMDALMKKKTKKKKTANKPTHHQNHRHGYVPHALQLEMRGRDRLLLSGMKSDLKQNHRRTDQLVDMRMQMKTLFEEISELKCQVEGLESRLEKVEGLEATSTSTSIPTVKKGTRTTENSKEMSQMAKNAAIEKNLKAKLESIEQSHTSEKSSSVHKQPCSSSSPSSSSSKISRHPSVNRDSEPAIRSGDDRDDGTNNDASISNKRKRECDSDVELQEGTGPTCVSTMSKPTATPTATPTPTRPPLAGGNARKCSGSRKRGATAQKRKNGSKATGMVSRVKNGFGNMFQNGNAFLQQIRTGRAKLKKQKQSDIGFDGNFGLLENTGKRAAGRGEKQDEFKSPSRARSNAEYLELALKRKFQAVAIPGDSPTCDDDDSVNLDDTWDCCSPIQMN